jgi:isopenicillin-N epimerase
MALRSPLADRWSLDPDVVFLNHGSYGACPTDVLAAQRAWQERMEREPVRWFNEQLQPALDEARARVAAFLHAEGDDLAFLRNATTGVNVVLRSLRFQPGDRILAADHEYNACLNAAAYVAQRDGATLDVATLPFPVTDPDDIVERVLDAVRPRTRLALLSALTSPTAVVMPIERLARELSRRGVEVLVDGAHTPGQMPVDLTDLAAAGVSYWTGNAHKWLCAPKGSGILWVRHDRQPDIRPLVISHGANDPRTDRSRFRLEFDWPGTDDWSAALAIPDAIDVMAGMVGGGWREVMARNHALAVAGRDLVCDRLGLEPATPDAMLGAMAAVLLPVPPAASSALSPLDSDPIQAALLARHRIQVPVLPWPTLWTPGRTGSTPSGRLLRLSAQLYNSLGAYELLAEALAELVGASSLGSGAA